jgi:hypothetical protein
MTSLRRSTGRPALLAALAAACLGGLLAVPAAPAQDPVASIGVSPAAPVAGSAVTLTAIPEPPDAELTSFAWEFDGDGDFAEGDERSVAHTFDAPGTYVVALRVTDADDRPYVVYMDLVVAAPAPPPPPPEPPAPPPEPEPAPNARLMDPFPVVRIKGVVTGRGARLTLVSVRAPRRATIVVTCRGVGCPRKRIKREGAEGRRMRGLEGGYRAGARLTFTVTARRRIGKYTRIIVRRGLVPSRTDRCLWPGRKRPRACPAPN